MAEVVLHKLSKSYGRGVHAVRECSLSVADGECVVIVGPSGCGKTTLLRMIAALERPDGGSVHFAGRDVTAASPRQRDVAMVFQDFALYPHMRVGRNLAFALRMAKLQHDEMARRIDRVAKLLQIEHLLDRKPGEVSGGERQRAAVGRVLVRQPACALFDEPLSNLDASLRTELRSEMKLALATLGTTSILVTHDQEEAMSIADRIVVMADGRIQQVGPPQEVYRRPANRFVAGFIGSPAMNFIEGRISDREGAVVFTGGGDISLPLSEHHRDHVGREVVLGVRPEDLSGSAAEANSTSIAVAVEHIEQLGSHVIVRCRTADRTPVAARLSRAPVNGAIVHLHLDPARVHLFEPGEHGRAVAPAMLA